jgi:hypothetical protein
VDPAELILLLSSICIVIDINAASLLRCPVRGCEQATAIDDGINSLPIDSDVVALVDQFKVLNSRPLPPPPNIPHRRLRLSHSAWSKQKRTRLEEV